MVINNAIRRDDFEILNKSENRLYCSLFSPASMHSFSDNNIPCVVYCHGNAGFYCLKLTGNS
jgi:hypothetical protein